MTDEQFKDGIRYAEDNFMNNRAPHLHVDKKLIKENFDLTGKKILDFGSGMGGMSLWYATNWDCEVHGIDIDAHHVTIANAVKKKHNITNVNFEVRNVLDTPLTEKYDYIFLNDVAEHIAYPILEPILQQLADSVSETGRVFITYPPWKSPYASHVQHVTKIPWCQFLPNSILLPMIERNNLTLVGEEESTLLDSYHGLNHLTHKKLIPLTRKAGLEVDFRKSHCILNKLGPLKNTNIRIWPLDYLITKEFLLLKRGNAKSAGKRGGLRVAASF